MNAPTDIFSREFAIWTHLQQALRDLDAVCRMRDEWKSEALRLRAVLADSIGDATAPPTASEEAARGLALRTARAV